MKTRRILAWVMSLALCLTLLPAGARAAVTPGAWAMAWETAGTEVLSGTTLTLTEDATLATITTGGDENYWATTNASFTGEVTLSAGKTLTLNSGDALIASLKNGYGEGSITASVTVSKGSSLPTGTFALTVNGGGNVVVTAGAKLGALTLTGCSATLGGTALTNLTVTGSDVLAAPSIFPEAGLALTLTGTSPASFKIGASAESTCADFGAPLTATVLYSDGPTVTVKGVSASGGKATVAMDAELVVKNSSGADIVKAKCAGGTASDKLAIEKFTVSGSTVTLKNAIEIADAPTPVDLYVAPTATLTMQSGSTGFALTGEIGCRFTALNSEGTVWKVADSGSPSLTYTDGFTAGSSATVQEAGTLTVSKTGFYGELSGCATVSFDESVTTVKLESAEAVLTVSSGALADSAVASGVSGRSVVKKTVDGEDIFTLSTPTPKPDPKPTQRESREPDEPYTQQIPATLTFDGGKVAVSPTNTVEKQTVTLTSIPDEGWELATLTVRRAHGTYPVALTNRGGGVYTFNHPGVEVVVEATFAPVSASQATQPTAPVQPAGAPKVVLSPQKIKVNGVEQTVEAYNIDGTNFFKLRDLAAMLGGTPAQFNVEYNAASNAVLVTKGAAYNGSVGTDFTDNSASAVPSPQTVYIDGAAVSLTAYNIGGNNFFGLRELATILGYSVDYDAATNTAIITTP
ncbi:MAG: hypothetical protein E7474_12620 [Ruminococcaceae bacterium]|nr:hypothetical protein [Oscillospiraceae bacterium]